jgi:hypothetical protein
VYNTTHISLMHDIISLKDEPFIGVTIRDVAVKNFVVGLLGINLHAIKDLTKRKRCFYNKKCPWQGRLKREEANKILPFRLHPP